MLKRREVFQKFASYSDNMYISYSVNSIPHKVSKPPGNIMLHKQKGDVANESYPQVKLGNTGRDSLARGFSDGPF